VANRENIAFGAWMTQLESHVHRNVAIVAVANKLARIAWAVLAKAETYHWPPALSVTPSDRSQVA